MLIGFITLIVAGLTLASPQAEYFKKLQERKTLLQKQKSISEEISRLGETQELLGEASKVVTTLRNESRCSHEKSCFDGSKVEKDLTTKKHSLLASLKKAQSKLKDITKKKHFFYIANHEFTAELLSSGRKFGDPSNVYRFLDGIWNRAWTDLSDSVSKSTSAIQQILDKKSEAISNAYSKSASIQLRSAQILKHQLDTVQQSIFLQSQGGNRYDPKKVQQSVYKWLEDKAIENDNEFLKQLEPFLTVRDNIDPTMEESGSGKTIFYSLPNLKLVHTRAIALLNLLKGNIDEILENFSLRVKQ